VVPEAIAEEVMAHSDDAATALDTVDWLERVPDATLTPRIAAWDLGPRRVFRPFVGYLDPMQTRGGHPPRK